MIFAGVITTGDLISYMLFALQVGCCAFISFFCSTFVPASVA